MSPEQAKEIITALCRIAKSLETLTNLVDPDKNALRMYDVERATVYKTHLGEKLREPQ
jgi:hypothetical protein